MEQHSDFIDSHIPHPNPLEQRDEITIDEDKISILHESFDLKTDHSHMIKYEEYPVEPDETRRGPHRKYIPSTMNDEDISKPLFEVLGLRCRQLPKEYENFVYGNLVTAAENIKDEFSKVNFLRPMKKRSKHCIRLFRRKRIFFKSLSNIVSSNFPWVSTNIQSDIKGFKSGDKIESAENGGSNEICTIVDIRPGTV